LAGALHRPKLGDLVARLMRLLAPNHSLATAGPDLKISWFVAALLLISLAAPAWAQEDKKTDDQKPADPDTGESTVEESTLGLLPNPFQKYGIKFAATYIGETQGNVSGGLRQGAVYDGRLNLAVDVDLQKLAGLRELTFHANMFQIHGDGLSRSNLQNFMVVSGIEALPSTRLYEIWFEQKWGNTFALRAGQLAPTPSSSIPNIPTCLPMPRWAGPRSLPSICRAAGRRRRWLGSAPACGLIWDQI
jgi:hypothetical protein